MISGRKNLLQWFKMNEKPYFSIFRKNNTESGNTVYNNKSREGETMETAAAYLDQCLSLITSGDFFIFCCKEMGSSTSKGRSETFFTVSSNESAPVPASAVTGIGGMDYQQMLDESDKRAQAKFEQLMTAHELKNLKEKNAVLEKENKTLLTDSQKPFAMLIKEVSPHIGTIIQQFGFGASAPTQLPISGTPHDETLQDNATEVEQQMSNTVNAFCEALQQRYPEQWLVIIGNLTNTLKTSPEKIDMALKFL